MTQSDAMQRDKRLYLDDLHVGQRFTSGTHVIDEIKVLSTRSRHLSGSLIRSRHLDDEAAKNTLVAGLTASG